MNKRSLSLNLGFSILISVAVMLMFKETKFYDNSSEEREISFEEYGYMKRRTDCMNCAELVTKKKVLNYETGGLVFISVFASILIVSNLKRK
ncbi:MAG: hypothetical protein RI922_2425 [Bacteroidota bacterium]|jgi:hypothetical protein